jgi:ubiquinone biosynthesis protein
MVFMKPLRESQTPSETHLTLVLASGPSNRFCQAVRSIWRVLFITTCGVRLALGVVSRVVIHRSTPMNALAQQLAPSCIRLGTTSIKLGQLIASSPGTFPAELVRACSELRDNVDTDDDFDVASLLESELGERIQRLRSIAAAPIAAASVAQVHVGRLDDGRAVAIKVQRPNIARAVMTDLRLLHRSARIAARLAPSLRRVNITGLVETLGGQLLSELDFTSELRNAQLMETAFAATGVVVPHCFADLCTSRVLVMEYLPGQPLSVCATRIESAGDGTAMAREVLRALLLPMVSHGVFHADMHGGNLLVGPSGRLGVVDFGSVSKLDPETRDRLTNALTALFERRFPDAAAVLMSLMDTTNADLVEAQEALVAVTSTYLDSSVAVMPVGQVIKELISIGTNHGIVMPAALVSLMRQMLFLDGITRELDSTFNFLDEGLNVMHEATRHSHGANGGLEAGSGLIAQAVAA